MGEGISVSDTRKKRKQSHRRQRETTFNQGNMYIHKHMHHYPGAVYTHVVCVYML